MTASRRALFPPMRVAAVEALEQRIAPAFVTLPSPTPEVPGVLLDPNTTGLAGTVVGFMDDALPTPFASGTLRTIVVDRDPTAGVALDFYYQLVNSSPGPDPMGDADFFRFKTTGGFSNTQVPGVDPVAVAQTTTLAGLVGGTSGINFGSYAQGGALQTAMTADRDVGSPGSVGFDFPNHPAFTGSPNNVNFGQSSAFLVVRTNAANFVATQSAVSGSSTAFPITFAPTANAGPANFVVTTTLDVVDALDGVVSLREAISLANANSGADTIAFNLAGPGGFFTIVPATPLPEITEAVVIDGYTQAGSSVNTASVGTNAVPRVVLNGAVQGGGHVLVLGGTGGSTVQGLIIQGAANAINDNGHGIAVRSDNNTITGNFIGTDTSGTLDRGNANAQVSVGLFTGVENFTGNRIGGTALADRNVLSGGAFGVQLTNDSFGTLIQGNLIGTGKTGSNAIPNSNAGIANGGTGTVIGGGTAGAGNVISGNDGWGINTGGTNTTIQGNFIGTNAAGTAALANARSGVNFSNGATTGLVGGSGAGQGNLISGNTFQGIEIGSAFGDGPGDNITVLGNKIGTAVDGTTELANGGPGIGVFGTSGAIIGGVNAGEGNVIAFNDAEGVLMDEVAGAISGVRIAGNSIHSNARLGIDLHGSADPANGVTVNDTGDADTGPNGLQNFPVITGVTANSVSGTLNTTASAVFTLHFYSNIGADLTGFGEGRTYLGSTTANTNGAGAATFSFGPAVIPAGSFVTATATTAANSTSEFSNAVQLSSSAFVVTTTLDTVNATDGVVSLREAIIAANSTTGTDTISFNIPGAGVQTIAPTSVLPAITDPVIIDGFSQVGSSANTNGPGLGDNSVHLIALSGVNAGAGIGQHGLLISAGGSTVRGLAIGGFGGSGILLQTLGGNVIEGNFIGTNTAGSSVLGNGVNGVSISGVAGNLIGGTLPAARNVISGNASGGVDIQGAGATGNFVQGNLIGTNATGTIDLGNTFNGVQIFGVPGNTIGGTAAGARNVISGNNASGVDLQGTAATGNLVLGNYIGTDVTGTLDLGNSQRGVSVNAPGNTVGGTAAGARNVISGNNFEGIAIFAAGNTVQGNYVGTNAAGSAAVANTFDGVVIHGENNVLGGTTAGAGNLISGNGRSGVLFADTTGTGNTVQGNFIGTNPAGTSGIPNVGAGILIFLGATSNTIGGTAAGTGNTIAFNGGPGLSIFDTSAGNAVRGNAIFSNTEIGIDLNGDGVTANDTGDGDTGPNGLQNFPVIVSASAATISGTLNSTAGTTLALDFFASLTADPSGFGEGRTYLGSTNVTTDGSGSVAFNFTPGTAPAPGSFITATATNATGGTSEFSAALPLVGTFIWDAGGGADTSWFNPLNWNFDSGVPGAADTAVLQTNATITLASNTSVGTFQQSTGTFTGGATLTTATFVWSGGTQGGFGTTQVSSTLNLANSGGLTLGSGGNTARTLISNGVATLSGGNLLISTSGGGFSGSSFINNGTFNVADGADILVNNLGGGPAAFSNAAGATFNKSGAGTVTTIGPGLTNSGTINLNSGTLEASGATTLSSGTLAVSAGTTLRTANNFFVQAAATLSGAGTLEVTAGSNVNLQSYALTGAVVLQGGSLNFTTLSRTLPTLTQSGGTLGGSGMITVSGALVWSGGTQNGSGTTIANGALDLTNVGNLNLGLGGSSQRTLISNGVATLSGGSLILVSIGGATPGSQFVNNGTFNVVDGADISFTNFGGPAPLFTNAVGGIFNKSGAGTVTTFSVPLSNAGTMNVNSGTLELVNNATNIGTLAVGAGATLRVAGATLTVQAAATLSGAGTLEVGSTGTVVNLQSYALTGAVVQQGGTLNFNALNPTLASLTQSGGLLTGSGTITVTGAMVWSDGLQGGAGTTIANGTLALPLTGFPTLGDGGNTGRTLINNGVATHSGTANLSLITSGGAAPGAQIINNGTFNATNNVDIVVSAIGGSAPLFTNAAGATFNKSGGGTLTTINAPLNNAGTINVNASGLELAGTFAQTGGATVLASGGVLVTPGTLTFQAGELRGAGSVNGSVNNTGATVRPGGTGAAGTITINGGYTQGAGGTLAVELGGTGAGAFDVLSVSGATTLGGTIDFAHINAFTPANGNTFRVVQSAGNPGTFATLTGATAGKTQAANATGLVITQGAGGPLTFIWDGGAGADQSWFNPLNWNFDSGVPGAGDAAVLNTNATINLPSSTSVGTFQQSDGTFTSPTGVTFTVLNSFAWSGGAQTGAGNAATVLPAGSASTLSGAAVKTLSGRALNVDGTLTWTGTGNFALNEGTLTVLSNGLFDIQNDALLGDANGNGTAAALVIAGTLKKTAGAGTSALGGNLGSGGGFVPVTVNASGTVRAEGGTLQFDGGLNSAGIVNALGKTIVLAAGSGTSSGTFHADAGGVVRITGGIQTLAAGAAVTGAGLFDIANGRVDLAVGATVGATNVALGGAAGTLVISGAMTISQSFDWTAGTIGGNGSLTLAASSVSTMSGAAVKAFTSGTINVGGTLAWSGTGTFDAAGSGQVIVLGGGLFDLQSDAPMINSSIFGGFNASIIIDGTLRKSAGAGVSRIDGSNATVSTRVNPTGRVEVQSGTLVLGDNVANLGTMSTLAGTLEINAVAGDDSGTYHAATGARVLFSGGARTLDAGAALTGPGLFEITGVGLVLNTDIAVQNLALHSSFGGIAGAGNLSVAQTLDWTAGFMTGTGKTTLPAASVSTMSGTNDKTLTRDLDLFGTLTIDNSGSTIFAINSNTLRVLPGGLLHLQVAAIVDNDSGTPGTLIVDGTLRKSGVNETASIGGRTTGTGSVNTTINAGGRVEVMGGPLDFRGNGVNSSAGVFDITFLGNTSLTFNAPFTLNAGAAITGTGTTVVANASTLTVAAPVSASGTLRLTTGTLALAAPLTQTGSFEWNGGTIGGANALNVAGLTIATAAPKTLSAATVNLSGFATWTGTGSLTLTQGAVVNIQNGATFDIRNAAAIFYNNVGAAPVINNAGTYQQTAGGNTATIGSGIAFTNTGTVRAETGALAFNGGFTQTAGSTVVAGGDLATTGTFNFIGGELRGGGQITGTVNNTGAIVRPGGTGAAAALSIAGTYTQGPGGTLAIEVGGATPALFDRLSASLGLTVGGTLTTTLINGFTPASGAQFGAIGGDPRSGTFATVTGPLTAQYNPGNVTLLAPNSTAFTWDGSDSTDWFNPNNWTPVGVPGLADTAILDSRPVAALTLTGQFSPGLGTLIGAGFDAPQDRVWLYSDSDSVIRSFSRSGVPISTVPRPGSPSNDGDIEFAPEALTLAGTAIPAGTLFFIDGESGTAEIYAVDKTTGAVLATLPTAFGASHVVGGAYHSERNTFFLITDQLDATPNRIAEIDPLTGAILNSFTTGGFAVNFGDLDVSAATGNLLLVSSIQGTVRELSATGALVQDRALPAGVSAVSGLGFDDFSGELLLSSTNGTVYRVTGQAGLAPNQPVLGVNHTVANFQQSAGTLGGSGTLTVLANLDWSGGTMNGSGATRVAAGGTLSITGAVDKTLAQRTLALGGNTTFGGAGNLVLGLGAIIDNSGGFDIQSDADFTTADASALRFNNLAGATLQKSAGPDTTSFGGNLAVTNAGAVVARSGLLDFAGGFTQTGAGVTELRGGDIGSGGTFALQGGELIGAGNIAGNVNNSGATVRPGGAGAAGTLSVTGAYTQGAGGTLAVEIGGAGTFDVLNVSGNASVAGTLNVALINAFTPAGGAQFQVLTGNARSGTFGNVTGPLTAQYNATNVTLVAASANANTVVTTTLDTVNATDGVVSLREAITFANATPGTDTITFNIPGAGVQSIRPGTALPVITNPVVIDGFSQPGASANTGGPGALDNAVRLIELSGIAIAAGSPNGLHITSGASLVEGLIVTRWRGAGIMIETLGGNFVLGNLIGADADASSGQGNLGDGISIVNSAGNTIGGTTPGERNRIVGNSSNGVAISGANATGNLLLGNFIGTDGNAAGSEANGGNGVMISSNGNVIGSTAAGARNVISGNTERGVLIFGSGNTVQGNYIGTDATGMFAVKNSFDGLTIAAPGSNNIIGGAAAGAGNVISGNEIAGVTIESITAPVAPATGNRVLGNLIGVAADGFTPLGNTAGTQKGWGVVFFRSATGNFIGGELPGEGNTIANNAGAGVAVLDAGPLGNRISGNSIFANGDLGIDLGRFIDPANSVLANDAGDADSGANGLLNFPVITSVNLNGGMTEISGSYSGAANATFTIEFFASDAGDASGFGEGETYLGSTTVSTDGSGSASFTFAAPVLAGGTALSATASDAAGNTSEFSGFSTLIATSVVVTTTLDVIDVDDGFTSLREAIVFANANAGLDTITFNIPGAGVRTISPTSALPTITDALVIDGFSQPGASANTLSVGSNAVLLIQLDGTNAGAFANGLRITAGGSTVQGLVINRFAGDGIELSGSGGNSILGNFIGLNAAGSTALGNLGNGVEINSGAGNTVGNGTAAGRNVISGNGTVGNPDIRNGAGVVIYNSGGENPDNTTVSGNYIGTDATGLLARGNQKAGVGIYDGPTGNTVNANVISGNIGHGFDIAFGSNGNTGTANIIGAGVDRTTPLGNVGAGVLINFGSSNNTIGGNTAALGNFISSNGLGGIVVSGSSASARIFANTVLKNTGAGILVDNSANAIVGLASPPNIVIENTGDGIRLSGSGTTGTLVQGNFVGVTPASFPGGTAAHPNGGAGVAILNGATGSDIGGTSVGNIIAGNTGDGVRIDNADNNLVRGNRIGQTGITTGFFPNGGAGVSVNDSLGVRIGSPATSELNIIAHNTGAGIQVTGTSTVTARGNIVEANGGLGIDLGGNGVTLNDAGDSDTGPNSLINFPTLTNVARAAAGTGFSYTADGIYSGTPNTTVTIDFYANTAADSSGFGEGQFLIHSFSVTTNGAGDANFSRTFTTGANNIFGSPLGSVFTSQATLGNGASGPSSEFSAAFGVNPGVAVAKFFVNSKGLGAQVEVRKVSNGELVRTFSAFHPAFKGGVRIASGDVNGDGVNDVIVGSGDGGGARVRVFDGRDLDKPGRPAQLFDFSAYGNGYRGGIYVAAGDVNGDGKADIIVSPGAGSSGLVRVFSGADGSLLRSFVAFGRGAGGVRVAAGDVNGDGIADIIAGTGAGSNVRVFDGQNPANILKTFKHNFPINQRGGVSVAAGDVNGDGLDDVIVGAAGQSNAARIFLSGAAGGMLQFDAFPREIGRGITVATVHANADGIADIIVAQGAGAPSKVIIFDGSTLGRPAPVKLFTRNSFDPTYVGGVFVA